MLWQVRILIQEIVNWGPAAVLFFFFFLNLNYFVKV